MFAYVLTQTSTVKIYCHAKNFIRRFPWSILAVSAQFTLKTKTAKNH